MLAQACLRGILAASQLKKGVAHACVAQCNVLQVLSKALSQWDLTVTPITHPQKAHFAANPGDAAGYICNLDAHWYTIRPVYGSWWNFNSLQTAPSPVGDMYLEAYLSTLRQQNWTIYVVEGTLHPCRVSNEECVSMNQLGRVWTPEEVRIHLFQLSTLAGEIHSHKRITPCWRATLRRASRELRTFTYVSCAHGACK